MASALQPRTRKLTIIAQDPATRIDGRILTTQVEVPAEDLSPGPCGYRVHVIDYDSSTGTLYKPLVTGLDGDPFEKASDATLLTNPHFHAQNAYAIVMRTLTRFEFALGRRLSWSFYGHQIKVAPHAFADANAFYSEKDQALLFGYFPGSTGTVFSCLSHDVVAHETTHALVDGLRTRYTDPSSPEQGGFHEGFGDIVALLSVFSLEDVIKKLIDKNSKARDASRIAKEEIEPDKLRKALLSLAEEMGQEMSGVRGEPLRRSAELTPSKDYLKDAEFQEPHRCGEILVAAMMNAFMDVWKRRLKDLGEVAPGYYDRGRVVEEGAFAADHLLTMSIRGLDYAPPTDVKFSDFLSALLTADSELVPDDRKYNYRQALIASFASYGISPTSKGQSGIWEAPDCELTYERVHFEPMQREPDEVFRFVWENRKALGLYEDAYSRVLSVRPCLRIGPDGFALRETVAEYVQILRLHASELKRLKIEAPQDMPATQPVTLYGGGALIFDEYGKLKFLVRNRVDHPQIQSERIKYLWENGYLTAGDASAQSFSFMHRRRAAQTPGLLTEAW